MGVATWRGSGAWWGAALGIGVAFWGTASPAGGTLPPGVGPKHYEIHRATSAIRVDGVLDEAAWQDALTLPVAFEWTPGDNATPPVATEFFLTFDERYLYAAWRCRDPEPGKIRAHLMDRDSIDTFVQDDHVGFSIDPFNDERRAYQFRINPLGVQADAFNAEIEGIEDWSFDLIWSSAAKIGPDGYVVEVAIPFHQLRFPATAGPQTWGLEVQRSWPRSVRHRMSAAPVDRDRTCGFCQMDKVTGFEGMKSGRNLELDPTLTGTRTDTRRDFPGGALESGDTRVKPGLSARWGVTTNLALNAAIDPDFSQVEADAAQLAVNERFALFFPEKRPFFLEGNDFFSTPVQAVFTRTVTDPKWGLKLSGKQGANAIGVFVTVDRDNGFVIPGNEFSRSVFLRGDDVTGAVLRYRRDVGSGSSIGLLATDREAGSYHNRLGGADLFWRFGATDTASLQVLVTDTAYPRDLGAAYGQKTESFPGRAITGAYEHSSRDWFWTAAFKDFDDGFRADAGFVPRVGIRDGQGQIQRQWWGGPEDRWTRINLGTTLRRIENRDRDLLDDKVGFYLNVQGPLQTFAEVGAWRSDTAFAGRRFDGIDLYYVYLDSQPASWVKATIEVDASDAVDFENVRAGRSLLVLPAVELKAGRYLNARVTHNYQRFTVDGRELFTANLTQLKLVYNFNVRAFARAIVQYQDLAQNPALYTFPVAASSEDLFTQFLFSYKLNPQTVLFLGYSDSSSGFDRVDLTRRDRTFFAKLGYALLF